MTKHKPSHIMIVATLVIVFSITLFISATAQMPTFHRNSYISDGFCRWWGLSEKVTTELIECNSTSNVYTRIDIHRNYGVPRFGIIIDCDGKVSDTVWYIPNNYGRRGGMIVAPQETDTAITVYWEEGKFSVKMMDLLTGNLVVDVTHDGQHTSLFEDFWPADTVLFSNSNNGTSDVVVFVDGAPRNKTDGNQGTIVDYSYIPEGIYFLYIVDETNSTIPWMITIRKGV